MTSTRFPLTIRSLVIGAIGAAVVCFVIGWGEMVGGAIQIAICECNRHLRRAAATAAQGASRCRADSVDRLLAL